MIRQNISGTSWPSTVKLWRRFTIALRRALARQAGLTGKAIATHLRVSYAKVAEYQRRGVVHFHAIIRLDGPAGPADTPPPWATIALLTNAIDLAARAVSVTTPAAPGLPGRTLAWGRQLDVRPVTAHGDVTDTTYRNRTDDLRITSRARPVEGPSLPVPQTGSAVLLAFFQSTVVQDHSRSLLARALACPRHAASSAMVVRWLPPRSAESAATEDQMQRGSNFLPRRALTVDLSAVARVHDQDQEPVIVDRVQNPVIRCDPDPQDAMHTRQHPSTRGPWLVPQRFRGRLDPLDHWPVELTQ